MSAAWIIYFAEISAGLKVIFFILSIAALIFILGALLKYADAWMNTDADWEYTKASVFRVIPFLIITALIAVAIPSERTIYLMAGAKVTEDIVKSPEAKELGDKILKVINQKVINQKLDSQIENKDGKH